MRNARWGLLLVTALGPQAFAADTKSRIDSVVVYPSGALITRTAAIAVPAGTSKVTLTDLPGDLGSADLRIAVADDAVQLGQVRVEREALAASFDADVRAAEAAVREQERAVQAIDDSVAAARLQLSFLTSLAQGYAKDAWFDGTRGTANVTVWKDALALLQEGSDDANRLIRDNTEQRILAVRELERRRSALTELAGSARRRSEATVSLASNRAVETTLSLTYAIKEARWWPVYEARLDSASGALRLSQIAEVNQRSAEDWTGVRLTLSTSEPSGELIPPELDTEFLAYFTPRRDAMADDAVQEIIVTGSRIRSKEMLRAAPSLGRQRAAVNISDYAVDYAIPGRVDIANNAAEDLTFALAAFAVESSLLTTVVPIESTEAFLQARFTYTESLPLFASSMRVYVDGVFAGETQMPEALPQSEVTLPMGQDRRIEVRVRPQEDERDRRGMISKRQYETTHRLYEITNQRPTATFVEVLDRYPVAEERDIRVEVANDATEPDERDVDDEPGIIKFVRRLEGGESWTIRQRFTVSYPADKTLSR